MQRTKRLLYILDDNGIKCECIITDEGQGVLEIKSIATVPKYQGSGYAKAIKKIEKTAELTGHGPLIQRLFIHLFLSKDHITFKHPKPWILYGKI